MSALTSIENLSSKPISKLAMAFMMTCFLSACGAGGGSDSSEVVSESQNTPNTDTEEQAPVQVAPVQISSNPQGLTVDQGDTAVFTVTAIGGGEISFQWRKNEQAIQGATSSTLALSNVSSLEAGLYDVVVTNSEGSETSLTALLAVNEPVIIVPTIEPVVITLQPQSVSVDENGVASFNVQVTGDGDITYQWLKDGAVIDEATTSSLNLSNVSVSDAASYSVMVTNSRGPVISEAASLTVTPVQIISSIELTWDIPQEREDGSDLSLGEINGYVIAYGTDQNDLSSQLSVEGASSTSTVLEDLSSGTYFFSIATIDSDGVQGSYSNVIEQSI